MCKTLEMSTKFATHVTQYCQNTYPKIEQKLTIQIILITLGLRLNFFLICKVIFLYPPESYASRNSNFTLRSPWQSAPRRTLLARNTPAGRRLANSSRSSSARRRLARSPVVAANWSARASLSVSLGENALPPGAIAVICHRRG